MNTEQKQYQLEPVTFHGDTIFAVEHNGEEYAVVRPIVENLELNWASQYSKLAANKERWGVVMIATPSAGGMQETVCIPVRKVAGFLATINPKKVRHDLRAKLIAYQNECDDALWQYWTTGRAERTQYFGGQQLPSPGLSMDAISGLCREADKYLKGKTSLRALHYFTGMPVDDLLEEIEAPDPSGSETAAVLARYLELALASGGHGLTTGVSDQGEWVQGTATQFFHAFTEESRTARLPRIFRHPKHLGAILARESEALEFMGWRRTGAQRTLHGYREHRFTRVRMAQGGAA